MTATKPSSPAATTKSVRLTGAICASISLGMVGLAYASVPLYDLFCKVTGYDGTPLVGTAPSRQVLDRSIAVRFDTNVAPGLNWRFAPEVAQIEAKLGETQTVFFKVQNTGSSPSTGIATFNVQPGISGAFFVKIQCFCFNEQILQPGETMDFPVVFYIDPTIKDDANARGLNAITLSYTYFASKNAKPVVTTGSLEPKPNL